MYNVALEVVAFLFSVVLILFLAFIALPIALTMSPFFWLYKKCKGS